MISESSDLIHVALAADETYAPCLALTLQTILHGTTSASGRSFCFWILDGGISDPTWSKIQGQVLSKAPEARLHRIPFTPSLPPGTESMGGNFLTYSRIFLADTLPIDRVIYLDCDLLVLTDLNDLWNHGRPEDSVVFAVIDSEISTLGKAIGATVLEEKNLSSELPYFNAGVLVVNLQEWRNQGMTARCLQLLKSNSPAHFSFWDQCVLNVALAGRVSLLPTRWNTLSQATPLLPSPSPDCILHFASETPLFRFKPFPTHLLYLRLLQIVWPAADPQRTQSKRLKRIFYLRRLLPLVHRLRGAVQPDQREHWANREMYWKRINSELDSFHLNKTQQMEFIDSIVHSFSRSFVPLQNG